MVTRGLKEEGIVFHGDRVSVRDDEKVLEMDGVMVAHQGECT